MQLFQGTPLLMLLFLAYFGLALFGINVSPWVAAALALTLYTSAFLTEIWRGTNATFRPFTVYACVALMYFVLCFPISAWSKSLEKKLHGHR